MSPDHMPRNSQRDAKPEVMNSLRKLVADWRELVFNDYEGNYHESYKRGVLDTAEQVENALPAWERLEKAAEEMLEVCPCQNGCAPDDMTCATNNLRAALKEIQK